MKDKFADLEEPKQRTWPAAVGLLIFVVFLFAYRWSGAKPEKVLGTVESAGTISVAKVEGSTQEAARVRLDNGDLAMAMVASGGPLHNGDRVIILKEARLFGAPAYVVTAKESTP